MDILSRRDPGVSQVFWPLGRGASQPATRAKTDGDGRSTPREFAGRGGAWYGWSIEGAAFSNAASRFPGLQPRLCRAFRSGHQDAPRSDADDVRGSKRGNECLWTTGLDIRRSRVHRPG